MKKFAIAAFVVLAACNGAEEAEPVEPAAEEMVAPAAVETQAMAADGQPAPGSYEITRANGDVWNETLNADGTYTSTGPDGTVENGRWEQRSPQEYCTMATGESEWECHAEAMSADGVWTSTEEGSEDTATVVRVS